ncbi:MAG TPA: hypothetical protein VGO93_27630 [Candidatus Xenobia bacterium]|jgi:hypothetical protein
MAELEECYLYQSAEGLDVVAWTAGLSEEDRTLIRQHTEAATGPGLVHYRCQPLDAERYCLSQLVSMFTGQQAASIHTLILPRTRSLDPFALSQLPTTFDPVCPYQGPTVPARDLALAEPDLKSSMEPLTNVMSFSNLAHLVHRAVLATPSDPMRLAPLHPAQTLPWFAALYACVPPAWRADLWFATWQPAAREAERWLALIAPDGAERDETVWDPTGTAPSASAASPYSRAAAEAIMSRDFAEVTRLAERVKGSRDPQALQEIPEASRQRPLFRRQERHDALLTLARDRNAPEG